MHLEATDQKEILNLSHPSLKDRSRQVIETVLQALRRESILLPLSDDELSRLLEKSIRNAMEHGNGWNPKKIVTVRVFTDTRAAVFEILDECSSLRVEKIEDLKAFFRSSEAGATILRTYCEPQWNERGNSLRIRIPRTDVNEGDSPGVEQDL